MKFIPKIISPCTCETEFGNDENGTILKMRALKTFIKYSDHHVCAAFKGKPSEKC